MKKNQSRLKKLDKLYETGAINEEEYETLKSELDSDKTKKMEEQRFHIRYGAKHDSIKD